MSIDPRFATHVEPLPAMLKQLLASQPFTYVTSPPYPERGGVYLFTEAGDKGQADEHMYVGRTGNLRQRLAQHCRPSSGHNSAPFTFLLARQATGQLTATYRAGTGRDALMIDPIFAAAFRAQNARINRMLIRYVEDDNQYRQTLFEVYAAVVLHTRYNDFDNH